MDGNKKLTSVGELMNGEVSGATTPVVSAGVVVLDCGLTGVDSSSSSSTSLSRIPTSVNKNRDYLCGKSIYKLTTVCKLLVSNIM